MTNPTKPHGPLRSFGRLKSRPVKPRQQALLDQMIWNVPEILHELSKLWQLRAGDLVFMGTPSGVAALNPGDRFSARLENVAERHGVIAG